MTPVAMATKFKKNICCNSACAVHITEIRVSSMGFSGSSYEMMSDKFYHDRPLLPWPLAH